MPHHKLERGCHRHVFELSSRCHMFHYRETTHPTKTNSRVLWRNKGNEECRIKSIVLQLRSCCKERLEEKRAFSTELDFLTVINDNSATLQQKVHNERRAMGEDKATSRRAAMNHQPRNHAKTSRGDNSSKRKLLLAYSLLCSSIFSI